MSSATLDAAFLDLELQAEVHLRPERVPLGDLCALSAGDLFALEHRPDEPVELFVNGRSVARGELIVVEGQFGIRITQAGPGSEVAAEAASEAAAEQAEAMTGDEGEAAAQADAAEETEPRPSPEAAATVGSEDIPGLDAAEDDTDA